MPTQESKPDPITEAADLVANDLDADVIHIIGPIERHANRIFIDECIKRQKRPNAFVVLVTMGGDVDPAYRIARCLQEKYSKFILYVSGVCKSAGTLVAVGAHELVISDHGELGPLDVQMSKKDELWEWQSGLTVMDTLTALQDNAFAAFEKFFLDIKRRSGGSITPKTASELATNMASGIFAPLYGQIDPLHVGEAARAMSIAGHYGRRLLGYSKNINPQALEFIMSEYPSHGFVIDRREAANLFEMVRGPNPSEIQLSEQLGDQTRWPQAWQSGSGNLSSFLSTELLGPGDQPSNKTTEKSGNEESREDAGSRRGGIAEEAREKFEGGDGNGEIGPDSATAAESRDIQIRQQLAQRGNIGHARNST